MRTYKVTFFYQNRVINEQVVRAINKDMAFPIAKIHSPIFNFSHFTCEEV